MKFLLRMLAAILLLTVALVSVARGENSGWIVFTSDRDGGVSIFLMTGDGGVVRRIAPTHNCVGDLGWSPDSRWIAFTSTCDGTAGALLRVRPDGSMLRVVSTPLPAKIYAEWSPDGERLVVVSDTSDLYIVEANGGDERLFARSYEGPRWSPDGDWIYARPTFNDESSLDRIHVDTGRVEALLPPQTVFSGPSWSPDGEAIVLAMRMDGGDALFIMDPDSGNLTMIPVDLPQPQVWSPHWSPDGEWIAFWGAADIVRHIYRIRPDGSDLQGLAEHRGIVAPLHWSPDSRWLLFNGVFEGVFNIFRLRADGSMMENLGPGSSPQVAPVAGSDWRPQWMIVAALGMFMLSMTGRFRR